MAEPIIVTFQNQSYTFDGKHWYGTTDYKTPPLGIIPRLTALMPAPPVPKTKEPVAPRRR